MSAWNSRPIVGCAMPTTVASSIAIALPSTVAASTHRPRPVVKRRPASSGTRAGHRRPRAFTEGARLGTASAHPHAAPDAAPILGAIVERPATLVVVAYLEPRPRAVERRLDDGGAELSEEALNARTSRHQLRSARRYHGAEACVVERRCEERRCVWFDGVARVALQQRAQRLAHVGQPAPLRVGDPPDARSVPAQPGRGSRAVRELVIAVRQLGAVHELLDELQAAWGARSRCRHRGHHSNRNLSPANELDRLRGREYDITSDEALMVTRPEEMRR